MCQYSSLSIRLMFSSFALALTLTALLKMIQDFSQDFTHQLRQLMQQAGVSSFKALSQKSGVSEKQLRRLRQGQILKLPVETLLKLVEVLQVSVNDLLTTFSSVGAVTEKLPLQDTAALKQEYQRLQQQLENQRETLKQEFQQSSLQLLESWMLQWPTAAYAAGQNQQLPAVKLLPLVRPVEQLLQQWGVEAIASVGSELPYDPQWHQMMAGTAQSGELVRVRYTGYRLGEKILHRAKVSLIDNTNKG